jgi:hypothetical protein
LNIGIGATCASNFILHLALTTGESQIEPITNHSGTFTSLGSSAVIISFSTTVLTGVSSSIITSFTSSTFFFLIGFCHFLNTMFII